MAKHVSMVADNKNFLMFVCEKGLAALDDARTVNAPMEKIAMDWLKGRGYLK
jgi:hypothetical protein